MIALLKGAMSFQGSPCETSYDFRVGAYGDRRRYETEVKSWSVPASATTVAEEAPIPEAGRVRMRRSLACHESKLTFSFPHRWTFHWSKSSGSADRSS